MKKSIIISIIVLLTCSSAIAQDEKPKKFHFGIKAGLNLSSLSNVERKFDAQKEILGDGSVLFGLNAGLSFNYAFNDLLGVQSEIVYSGQGGGNRQMNYGKIRRDYVNFPLLIDIKPFKRLPLNILAGGQVGFCMATWDDGKLVDYEKLSDFGPMFPLSYDFAAVFGIQYTFIKHLTLGLRYNLGLKNTESIETNSPAFATTDENGNIIPVQHFNFKGARNNVLQLSVGWTF